MTIRHLAIFLLGGAVLLLGASCKQTENERCEIPSDCASGLECCPDNTCHADCNASQSDGSVTFPDAGSPDAASAPDAAQSLDASVTQDASP